MVDNAKATNDLSTTEPGFTFGGTAPDLEDTAPETSFSGVSLVDNVKPDTGLVSLTINGQPSGPNLTDEELNRKVDRFHFALHKDFSRQDIQKFISSGNEQQLRQYAAEAKNIRDENDRQITLKEILGEGLPETPEQQSILYGNVKALNGFKPQNNPNTVVEEQYAKRFIESVPSLGPQDNAINQLMAEVGAKAVESGSQARIQHAEDSVLSIEEAAIRSKVLQENAKDVLEKAERTYAQESTFGKIIDFGKSSTPFYDYYNMVMDVPGMEAVGVLPGSTIADWIIKLYDQPPAVQKEWLNAAVDKIGAYNPQLAVRVAEAAVNYSSTEKFLDNMFGVLDVKDAPGLGLATVGMAAGVATAIGKAAKAAALKRQAVNAFRTSITASANPAVHFANFQAAMGNINGAAVHTVASTTGSQATPVGAQNIAATASSFINPTAAPGSANGLAAAQTGRFASYVQQRAGQLKAKIDEIVRVNRLPEEALQEAFTQTQQEFEDHIGQVVNNAFQNAAKVSPSEEKLDRLLAKRGANMQGVPKGIDPDAILRPDQIPANDPMREQLIKHYERKQATFDERQETLKALEEEGLISVPKQKEAPKAPLPTITARNIRPEETPYNLGMVEFELTKPNGQMFSGPHWNKEMETWGRLMGLQPGDYGARQRGNGWVMVIEKPIDETKPYVRDHLITTTNTQTPAANFLDSFVSLRRGGGRVSEFSANNRIAYVMGQEKVRELIQPLAADLLSLKRKHVDALNRVMTEEMNRIDPATNLPGYFYENHTEFENAYRRLNGRSPTTKETNAYVSARILNDLEYGMRSASYYKELARLGIKRIELKTKLLDPTTGLLTPDFARFEGKVIDKLPLEAKDAKARAMVTLYHEGDTNPKIVPLHALLTEKGQGHIEELQNQGYKIIQTANPVRKPGKEVFGEDESVNFIITKDFNEKELDASSLIGYREGWHQIYPYKHYIKQPVVRRIDKVDATTGKTFTHHIYEGETTLMGVHSKAEAIKYAEAMEEARQIAFEGKAGNLDLHLASTLPYDRKGFMDLFNGKNPKFSKTEPFHALGDGHSSMDTYKTKLEGRYGNLYDAIRSPWNLMNQVDKKFVGHRDEVLHTVKEGAGSQNNPVFNLVRAERLDPLSAMSDGIANMVRNQHMIDLRLQMGESWIKEFGHILDENPQTMYNDLVNTIMNPPYIKNIENINFADHQRAEHARQAFLELMNLETPLQAQMENLRSNVIDSIYHRMGQETSNEWATAKIMTTRHPASFLRGIVYHAKVGFLNPMVAIQNTMQIANVLALSPVHGAGVIPFGTFAWLTRLNSHPAIVDAMGALAEKATFGKYKKAWFNEAIDAMKRSGYWAIGGGHSLSDYLNDPKFIASKTGKVMDATGVLFKESEKLLRTNAFMTAFIEHKVANPNKAITSIDLNNILGRANLYAGRMSRDEKARWQSGEVLSTVTQFWSYQARLTEMLLEGAHGRRDALTGMEKFRLVAMNAALYGIPAGGMGALAGGVINSYDHIKEWMVDNGYHWDEGKLDYLFSGVLGVMSKEYLGANVAPAVGPTGRDITQALDSDLGWFGAITGPSGGLILHTIQSAHPYAMAVWMGINGEPNPAAIPGDLLDIARNVSSIDKATKMYLAWKYHKAFTKSGQELGSVETWPGIVSAITGQAPNEYDHDMVEREVLMDLPKKLAQLGKQAAHDFRLSQRAHNEGDYKSEAYYAKRANIFLSGLSLTERQQVMHKAIQGDKALIEENRRKWEQHRPEVTEEFKKAYKELFTNVPTD